MARDNNKQGSWRIRLIVNMANNNKSPSLFWPVFVTNEASRSAMTSRVVLQ